MPIYEYECASCGHRFEKLMRISAEAPACPECDEVEVRKLVSQSGFILKGGGWYKDHYGLKSGGKKSGDSGGESAEGATKKSSSESSGADKATPSTSTDTSTSKKSTTSTTKASE